MEIFQFLLHQKTHRRLRDELCDANRRGMGAVRCAEGVVHINVRKFRERFREFRIVRFFFGLETQILEQRHVAILHVRDDLLRHISNRVVTENDRMID